MQWIRNGKKYDTVTAELIGSTFKTINIPSEKSTGNLKESFYQKKKGECFLVKEITIGFSRNEEYLEKPELITFAGKEAKKWAEENLSVREYEKAFGKVEE